MSEMKPLDLRTENPYPEDIFPEITKEEWEKIDELLKRELGFQLDRVAGNINRKMWNNIKEWFLERIKSAVQGLLNEVEKMENYATKIQKEDLTEFMKGYWKGQQNLINELKRQIKKWFPDIEEGERK